MTTDFRALCAELTAWAEKTSAHYFQPPDVLLRARAALADEPAVPEGREPVAVTEQPSDEEIMGLMPQQMHEDLAYAARAMANEAGTDNRKAKGFMRIALNRHAVDLARAVLAHWGNPAPAPPADGEVAELVEWLQEEADDYECIGCEDSAAKCERVAELLKRLASPACVVLEPSPELIEAFQDALPGRIEPLLEERHPAPVPVGERLPQPEVGE